MGELYNSPQGTGGTDEGKAAGQKTVDDAKTTKNKAMENSKKSIAAGGDPLWDELYGAYGTPGDPSTKTGNWGQQQSDAEDYAYWVKLWRDRETKKNLGYATPEEAWFMGMDEGADPYYRDEANRWGKTAAPEMWNAAGQRDTRAGALDALRGATQGGLAADIQDKARREAALMASARGGQQAQANLAGAQSALANTGMQAAIKERAARAAALGQGLKSGRAQELEEAQRMQDWTLQREALRQKMLGMGLQQKNRRFDILGDYIRAKQASSMDEFALQQQTRAAEKAKDAQAVTTGAQVLSSLTNLIPRDEGGGDDDGSGDWFYDE